jgi:hypothetical protein
MHLVISEPIPSCVMQSRNRHLRLPIESKSLITLKGQCQRRQTLLCAEIYILQQSRFGLPCPATFEQHCYFCKFQPLSFYFAVEILSSRLNSTHYAILSLGPSSPIFVSIRPRGSHQAAPAETHVYPVAWTILRVFVTLRRMPPMWAPVPVNGISMGVNEAFPVRDSTKQHHLYLHPQVD